MEKEKIVEDLYQIAQDYGYHEVVNYLDKVIEKGADKVDLWRIPYSTLEEHLKTRREETESYLKWCAQ